MNSVEEYVNARRKETLEELTELLRIPSVSTTAARRPDMERCASLIAKRLEEAGLKTRILPTAGHPAVYGERTVAGRPTVLVYGHYDVQPAEPLDAWRHDPFEPAVEGEHLIARGASDDKGQFYSLVKGIEAYLRTREAPCVGVKVLIEGEEEVGSPNLKALIREQKDLLRCDFVTIADCGRFARDLPSITYGLRGLVYLQVTVRGPCKDLHSGSYGGAVANPANVLVRMLSACQGPFGRIAIPGFYDDVRELETWEREQFAGLPFSDAEFQTEVGAPRLWGEEGYTTLERKWARPTFELNGLMSGYTGEGAKTVLPSVAQAKLSMRLVPDQDPAKVSSLVAAFLRGVAPASVEVDVQVLHGAKPILVPREGRGVRAAAAATARAFGKEPVFIREGGSIPVVNTFREELGVDSVLLGLGLPDDDAHGPNEKLRIEDFYRGMVLMGALLEELERDS